MKYFKLKENPLCQLPSLNNWRSEINVKNICVEKKHLLPRRKVIDVETNENTFFSDVMLNPFILFSEELFNIIKIYEPSISGRQIILLDGDNEFSKLYYIPIIEKINVVKNKEYGQLQVIKNDLKYLNIFIDAESGVPIINLDLAESILKRDIRGIKLESIELNIV